MTYLMKFTLVDGNELTVPASERTYIHIARDEAEVMARTGVWHEGVYYPPHRIASVTVEGE